MFVVCAKNAGPACNFEKKFFTKIANSDSEGKAAWAACKHRVREEDYRAFTTLHAQVARRGRSLKERAFVAGVAPVFGSFVAATVDQATVIVLSTRTFVLVQPGTRGLAGQKRLWFTLGRLRRRVAAGKVPAARDALSNPSWDNGLACRRVYCAFAVHTWSRPCSS